MWINLQKSADSTPKSWALSIEQDESKIQIEHQLYIYYAGK